eukprot:TRINITY_DN14013_c0_g2_i1.p1 TRINITY_DN14013_c0_g2~~TRINITY_DN14013_c0_g2_i1.p1  ORF type:complete len:172 (-),score=25.69 TRINITY_DN14013_c0_g2_i1:67-582(-)
MPFRRVMVNRSRRRTLSAAALLITTGLLPRGLEAALDVSVGTEHSCALANDGSVICWGEDNYGQSSPPPETNGGIVALSSGTYHTCAMNARGSVSCWGSNGFGRSGVPEGTVWRSVSGGATHSCAISQIGQVICWGSNRDNQQDIPDGDASMLTQLCRAGRLLLSRFASLV